MRYCSRSADTHVEPMLRTAGGLQRHNLAVAALQPPGHGLLNHPNATMLGKATLFRVERERPARRSFGAAPAAFTLLVDAKNNTAAALYRHHGFLPLASQPGTLFLPLATLEKAWRDRRGG